MVAAERNMLLGWEGVGNCSEGAQNRRGVGGMNPLLSHTQPPPPSQL